MTEEKNYFPELGYLKLKPRDFLVLIYLLRRPADDLHMPINEVAATYNISKNTVYAALKKLQQLGFVSYERLSSGKTHWFVHIPSPESVDVYKTF